MAATHERRLALLTFWMFCLVMFVSSQTASSTIPMNCPDARQMYFADPSDCTKYFVCSRNLATRVACHAGEVFDAAGTMTCKRMTPPAGCNMPAPAPASSARGPYNCPMADGRFQDTSDCTRYYNCRASVSQILSCNPGEVFDPTQGFCADVPHPPGCHMPEIMKPTSPADPKPAFMCPNRQGAFQDMMDCSKYYYCNNWTPGNYRCPDSQLFDPVSALCSVTAKPTGCNAPAAAGVGSGAAGSGAAGSGAVGSGAVGTAAIRSAFRCPYMTGNFQDMDDCSKFFSCTNFEAKSFTCNVGELFDPTSYKCARIPKPSGCRLVGAATPSRTPSALPARTPSGTPSALPARTPSGTPARTPSGTPARTRTTPLVTVPVATQLARLNALTCPRSEWASLVGHPFICNAFFMCGDGAIHKQCMFCGQGLYFETSRNRCEATLNVDMTTACNSRIMVAYNDMTMAQVDGTCWPLMG